MKIIAAFTLVILSAVAQDRASSLDPTDAEIHLAVVWLAESHAKWQMPPEAAATPKAQAKPAPMLSREEAAQQVGVLGLLVPTGRLIWDKTLRLYVPEFR